MISTLRNWIKELKTLRFKIVALIKDHFWMYLGVVAATFSQMLFMNIGYAGIEENTYGGVLKYISVYAIWGVLVGSPATILASLSFASSSVKNIKRYQEALNTLRILNLGSFCLVLLHLVYLYANKRDINLMVLTFAIHQLIGFQFSLDRGFAIGARKWEKVFEQLIIEAIAKVLLLLTVVLVIPASLIAALFSMVLPQIVAIIWFRYTGKSFISTPINLKAKLPDRDNFGILLSLWANGFSFIASASVPTLIAMTKSKSNPQIVNTLAIILIVCRLPLSFSGAVFAPKLINAVRADSRINIKTNRDKKGTGLAISIAWMILLGVNYALLTFVFRINVNSEIEAIAILTAATFLFFIAEYLTTESLSGHEYLQIFTAWTVSVVALFSGLLWLEITYVNVALTVLLAAVVLVATFIFGRRLL